MKYLNLKRVIDKIVELEHDNNDFEVECGISGDWDWTADRFYNKGKINPTPSFWILTKQKSMIPKAVFYRNGKPFMEICEFTNTPLFNEKVYTGERTEELVKYYNMRG